LYALATFVVRQWPKLHCAPKRLRKVWPCPSIRQVPAHGIDISSYRARQVTEADFRKFGHIYVMDQNNLRDLHATAPWRPLARIGLLMDVVPGRVGTAVLDPYYGGEEDFAEVWEDVTDAAKRIVAKLAR